MFKQAIVRTPCRALVKGISSHPELGRPDYERALAQHAAYVRALETLGLVVTALPADEAYPDGCFVEDTAVLTEKCAVLTNPGAESRRGEVEGMLPILRRFYREEPGRITAPGTLEGGDVMRVEDRFYVGRSARTNDEGIRQFTQILTPRGYTVVPVTLREVLHLKTGVNYLSGGRMLVSGEFVDKREFASYDKTPIPPEEDYAANCLWINGTVIIPAGFPRTRTLIEGLGYGTLMVDTSEFRKIDGGLSCLSLRF
jgi:dimethylargininase